MKTRLVDVLLLVGLFLVGAAILWTLFTLGNDRTRPARPGDAVDPPAAAATTDDSGDVQAVPLGDDATTPADRPGASPGATAAEQDENVDPADDSVDPADPTPDIEASGNIVPGDPVPLERVGFSFTTGGAGACGITLEPWDHIAVSRDLLAVYGCGTEVTLELADETAGRTEVTVTVADTMNPQFTRTVNVYVDPEEPALQYGITDGVLRP